MCILRLPTRKTVTVPISTDAEPKSTTPRPYTTYNIFFQLEREYILQHDLHVVPDLRPDEVFDPTSPSYDGPALPDKYQGLLLRADWHLPGKNQRQKKRQHRASHGAIGFCELSKRISAAWRTSDADVKLFCARLADAGAQLYRKERHELKKASSAKGVAAAAADNKRTSKRKATNSSATTALPEKASSAVGALYCPSVSPEIDVGALHLPQLDFASLPAELSSFLMDVSSEASAPCANQAPRRVVSADQEPASVVPVAPVSSGFDDLFFHPVPPVPEKAPSSCAAAASSRGRMVDMLDDEIVNIWMRD